MSQKGRERKTKLRAALRLSIIIRNGSVVIRLRVVRAGGERASMSWAYLFGLGLVLWGGCGAVIAVGRRIWTLDTTLKIYIVAAPICLCSIRRSRIARSRI